MHGVRFLLYTLSSPYARAQTHISLLQVWIEDFADRHDLINTCMASAHVPVLLDLKLSRPCRGAACVDGSFPDFFTGVNADRVSVWEAVRSSLAACALQMPRAATAVLAAGKT